MLNYHWNWSILSELSPDGMNTYLQSLLNGLQITLTLALSAWVLALVLGLVVGVMRATPIPVLVRLGDAWVELFRNIPLLVQMFLWFYVFPELLPENQSLSIKGWADFGFFAAFICLGTFTSARVAEQVRAGIQSLPRGQAHAAKALGFSLVQTYRYLLLPQGLRIILPPLTSEFLNIIKNSSVALMIGVMELTGAARSMQEFSFQVFEAFSIATLLYFLSNLLIVGFMKWVEYRSRIPGLRAAGQSAH